MRDCYPHLRVFPGCFTRPTGDLGLQLCRRTDHVETWSPPYVEPHCSRGSARQESRARMRALRTITVVGCHAGGEVGNVVVGGVLPPPGDSVFEQMQHLQDARRRASAPAVARAARQRRLSREPRGSGNEAGLRRRVHHHGADRVPADVRLEHDLHGDGAARDRRPADVRAGDRPPARGAGRRRRGAGGLSRRPLRKRGVHERPLFRRSPRCAAGGRGPGHDHRRRRLRRHVVRDRRRGCARLRDRTARGA